MYQEVIDKHFTSLLHDIAQGHKPTGVETHMLVRTLKTDVVQTAIIPITKKHSAENIVEERMHILQKIWPAFSQWWLQYLKINKVEDIPVDTLWRFYIPLSQWVVEQKRSLGDFSK